MVVKNGDESHGIWIRKKITNKNNPSIDSSYYKVGLYHLYIDGVR